MKANVHKENTTLPQKVNLEGVIHQQVKRKQRLGNIDDDETQEMFGGTIGVVEEEEALMEILNPM